MSDASDRGWGSGWPRCQTDEIVPLVVRGVEFPGGCRRELRELLTLLLEATHDGGYELHDGWCWGFACRPIKHSDGSLSDVASNHSWGLAVDINAPENPYGGTSYKMPSWVVELFREYGFRWGGDYRDFMHMEYLGSPTDAVHDTERAEARRDDEMFADWKTGWDAHEAGKQVQPDWPPLKKEGWRDRNKVIRDAKVSA